MANFEEALKKINRFITIRREDREEYMSDFNKINEYIIGQLRKDLVFGSLYNGHFFQGSYADNLKIEKPDEYDILIQLKLPRRSLVEIYAVENEAGYVKINVTDIINCMTVDYSDQKAVKKKLTDWSTFSNGFLNQKQVTSWLQSLMSDIINNIPDQMMEVGTRTYKIHYSVHGPAQTLEIKEINNVRGKKISVDYVPAFVFEPSQSVAPRVTQKNWHAVPKPKKEPQIGKNPNLSFISSHKKIGVTQKNWHAAPKPKKEPQIGKNPNLSFISSFCDSERDLIDSKNQLKNIIRVFKKLRNKLGINNLKSYHIKTIFLWENEVVNHNFWDRSATVVFIHMSKKLMEYLEKQELPFFWDRSQNMFFGLKEHQITSMRDQCSTAIKKILTYIDKSPIPDEFYKNFLYQEEIDAMNRGTILSEIGNEDEENPRYIEREEQQEGNGIGTIGAIAAGFAIGGLILAGIFGRRQND